MLRATTACIFSTYQLPKSAPKRRRFIRFDLDMCFVREPPDCTLHHLHFRCFERVVFMLYGCCRCRAPMRGAASRCCLQVLLSKWRVWSGAGTLVPLQSAAAGCRRRVLLEGGAVRVVGALWNGYWCRCRVLLRGAAAGRRCRLLLGFEVDGDASGCCSQWRVRFGAGILQVPLRGAVGGCCCCQNERDTLERTCWCLRRVLLSEWCWWRLRLCGERLVPIQKICCPIWGLCWRN